MLKHLKPLGIGLFEHCFHTVKQWQTHSLKQIRQPVVAHTMNTIHVSHVALQQTKVSGHMVMEASDLRMLTPEADQNIVKGLILSSVVSTKYTVNDIMCLLNLFLTLNLVGQGVIRTHKHIPSFVGLPFTFHITSPQCLHEHLGDYFPSVANVQPLACRKIVS